jgi:hypothetical protein
MERSMTVHKPHVEHDTAVTAPEGSALPRPAPPPDATAAEASATSPSASSVVAPCGSRRKRRPKFVL